MGEMSAQERVPVNLKRVIWPVLAGLLVSGYQIYSGWNTASLLAVEWSRIAWSGLLPSLLLIVLRDAAYVWRLRLLTENRLSLWSSIQVIMLWEFGSAITPGAVGGIALAVFLLRLEKIPYGRGTAIIMITTFLDNLAYISMFGLLYSLKGASMFDVSAACISPASGLTEAVRNLSGYIWLGYVILFGITALLAVGLYLPETARKVLAGIARFPLLRRWENSIRQQSEELLITAREFRNYSVGWFVQIFLVTLLSWLSRYLLVVVLIVSFSGGTANWFDVFVRQYVVWMMLIVPTTPGASGIAELLFESMNCEFLPGGIAGAAALVWRLLSYYFYLAAGMLILPRWLSRVMR
jgi:uncharacterized protein (TIRG00374 family)